jgi:hypothetical protein
LSARLSTSVLGKRGKRGDIANIDICRRMFVAHRQMLIFAMSPFFRAVPNGIKFSQNT